MVIGLTIICILITPLPKIDKPTSTVVFSADDQLLGARIADDGQWRFPKIDLLPLKYEKALLTYEDRWFYYHLGVNPVSLFRALKLNIKHRKVKSGGSTISMQVARLSRDNPNRNLLGKLYEMILALKLELTTSKKEILRIYASAAPFGGNVVGIEAASWRYFERQTSDISWAEAATLAVLPNAPSLIYPGKNQQKLKEKRDNLLLELLRLNQIDTLTYQLSIAEALPLNPNPLPNMALHVTEQIAAQHKGERIKTSIESSWQIHLNRIIARHHELLKQNHINNLAALIVEVETGNIIAYVGNINNQYKRYNNQVDIVTKPRSSGSILKPFLYASMLNYGEILPHTLVKDVPINFAGYSPKNFDLTYSGAVSASQALIKSLNVPAVEMLYQFGEKRFLDVLRLLGFSTLKQPASHYGLSLILGGAEVNLLELSGAYASMARVLNHYNGLEGYSNADYITPTFTPQKRIEHTKQNHEPIISASSIWFTFEALREVNRPEERAGWWNFSSSGNVAWKTGTSFGFRDAWAVGITTQYVVAVWAGNASGEGRAGLTGSKAAGPVLFDILDFIPANNWFTKPTNELTSIDICAESGHLASSICPNKNEMEIPVSGLKTTSCPYHKMMHVSSNNKWRVNSSCYPIENIKHQAYFILPPSMEWYYRKMNPGYQLLPPMFENCESNENIDMIELLYPRNLNKLFVPNEMDGSRGKIVFEAAHRSPNSCLYWYLNEQFVGETKNIHQIGISPLAGKHKLTIIDEKGNVIDRTIEVLTQ